jgi:CRISPR type III-B/RAMP module RAMP protein Cmr1
MKQATYTLKFLTPCFCAGANPAKAEVRASSIRGQLRWWFRVLGGTAEQERDVFGGVAGCAAASTFILRIEEIQQPSPWVVPKNLNINSDAYVYYFASVSGTERKGQTGPRWRPTGALAPGTTVKISLLHRRALPDDLQRQFEFALRCFLQLGGIGLRVTRGLGAFVCREMPFDSRILDELRSQPFSFMVEHKETRLSSPDRIAKEIGALVKRTRKKNGMKYDQPSPLGSSTPRQTSAIYFRPVCSNPDSPECSLVVFEAPHDRVLGTPSRKPMVVGHSPSRIFEP